MNIFELIGSTTSAIEPFHSRFLARALEESLRGDCSLFNKVWQLAAPSGWSLPGFVVVSAEKKLSDGRRVDICLIEGNPPVRVLAIEVKTTDASADDGQLEKYLSDLKSMYPEAKVQIAYLTPFNRQRAGEMADRLRTVGVFEEFRKHCPGARHLSWLDVAEIDWADQPLWSQHQSYIRRYVSPEAKLESLRFGQHNRQFESFFLDKAAHFWVKLAEDLDVNAFDDGVEIDLTNFHNDPSFIASSLTESFKILLQSDRVSRNAQRKDDFADDLRRPFLKSPYAIVHEALFDLSKEFGYVWVKGLGDYGIRTAHRSHLSSGVSLVSSKGPTRLIIGRRR